MNDWLSKRHKSTIPEPPRNPNLSRWSSPAVPNSGWCSSNFMLGAGMVIIQRTTHKIVVIEHHSEQNYWFFPRGRKDLGETLEAAALRESYEESGYRAEFLPIHNPSRAPAPSNKTYMYDEPNTEPIYVTLNAWAEKRPHVREGPNANLGHEYLNFYYLGQITEDAVPESGTTMKDEEGYVSHLLSYEEALKKVWGCEQDVLKYAWAVYLHTLEVEEKRAALEKKQRDEEERKESKSDGVFRRDHGDNLGTYEASIASVE